MTPRLLGQTVTGLYEFTIYNLQIVSTDFAVPIKILCFWSESSSAPALASNLLSAIVHINGRVYGKIRRGTSPGAGEGQATHPKVSSRVVGERAPVAGHHRINWC